MTESSRSSREQTLRRVLGAAMQLPASERVRFVQHECGTDQQLQEEIVALLDDESVALAAADTQHVSLGMVPTDTQLPSAAQKPPPSAALPERIGSYRILRLLGSGGMGSVYEATQANPQRRVALKVINARVDSDELRKRFRYETQVLGRLQHPGIAQIYESKIEEDGQDERPFFAMELVDGLTLTKYAACHQLTLKQRLELVAHLCDAIHHAHQKGIVHRDLKPGNVLVTQEGRLKVLDFGIARALDGQQALSVATQLGQIVGTVHYMSPEQATAGRMDVDARSDIYSVGVLLFELLTGELPYQLKDHSLVSALHVIQHDEPLRLSSRRPELRGDVETIVSKAMRKDRDQRYSSAAELGEDIRRYARDEPILARPPSTLYLLGKFAKRNRVLVASVCAIAVLLVASTCVTTWLALESRAAAQRERQERLRWQRAERQAAREAEKAQQVVELTHEMLTAAAPGRTDVGNLTVREVLDTFKNSRFDELQKEPEVAATLRATLSGVYRRLGDYSEAIRQVEEGLRLAETLGPLNPTGIVCKTEYAMSLAAAGRLDEAARFQQSAVDDFVKLRGAEHRDTAFAMARLGNIYSRMGRLSEAEGILKEALARSERINPKNDPRTVNTRSHLAGLYFRRGQVRQAEAMFRENIETQRAIYGGPHVVMFSDIKNLAICLIHLGRPQEAAPLLEEVFTSLNATLGPTHPTTLSATLDLGRLHYDLGNYERSLPLVKAFYETPGPHASDNYEYYQEVRLMLGELLIRAQQYDAALPILDKAYSFYADRSGPFGELTQRGRNLLKRLFSETNRLDEFRIYQPIPPVTPGAINPDTVARSEEGVIQLQLSTFEHPLPTARHVATRWQIRPAEGDYDKSPALDVTTVDAAESLQLPAFFLDSDKTYYWRARYQASNHLESEFSAEAELRIDKDAVKWTPLDLTPYFSADVVRNYGDDLNDPFDSDALGSLLEEGFDGSQFNDFANGLPKSRQIGGYRLGDYDLPNAVQLTADQPQAVSIDVPDGRYVALRSLVAGGNGGSRIPVRFVFGDGSTVMGVLPCLDWFSNTGSFSADAIITRRFDGMDRWDNDAFDDANGAALFEVYLPIDSDRQLIRLELLPTAKSFRSQRTRFNLFAAALVQAESEPSAASVCD